MNQNTLLNLIRVHAPISRARLKELSGLSLGTIVGITSILIENQLVTERGVAESTGGRKAGLLEILPNTFYALGVSLMEYRIVGTVLNLHGDIIYEGSVPASLRDNAEHAVELLSAGIEAFLGSSNISRDKIVGLGCGISGPVSAQFGISVDSSILNWHNVEIGVPLSERLNMPVFVDNAVNCLASYEKLYGQGKPYQDFLLVSLGRGLGMASVVGDILYRGFEGIGAEFGHIPLLVNGRRCSCGKLGCLEEYVADRGIYTTYREMQPAFPAMHESEIDERFVDMLYNLAQQGDSAAKETFHQTGTYLGVGLATLVNLFNPACIILYGGDGQRVKLLVEPMKLAMHEHIFSQLGQNLELIVQPDTHMSNWARGAACLVLNDFFAAPSKA